jgi:hypothetical protein
MSSPSEFVIRVTSFPPDVDLDFEVDGSHLKSNAPVEMRLPGRPQNCSAGRPGYVGRTFPKPGPSDLFVELEPDRARAAQLLAEADSSDKIVAYILLFPSLGGDDLYAKLQTVMEAEAGTIQPPAEAGHQGEEILRHEHGSILLLRTGAAPSGGIVSQGKYRLVFQDSQGVVRGGFTRNPVQLLDLQMVSLGSSVRLTETSLVHLPLSTCDCYTFKISLTFSLNSAGLFFEEVTYRSLEKTASSGPSFSLTKRIPQS